MKQKFHQHFAVISVCLLQSCANPLGGLGKLDGNTGIQAAETAISTVRDSDTPDTTLAFPQPRPTPVEISLRNRDEELEKISPANKATGWSRPLQKYCSRRRDRN
jgi:hypothetical protein